MEEQGLYQVAWEVKPKPKKLTKTQEIAQLKATIVKQKKIIDTLWQGRKANQWKSKTPE
jgi:hypothetical protein